MSDVKNCLNCRFGKCREQKGATRIRCEALPEPFRFAAFWVMEDGIFAVSKMGCTEVKDCPAHQVKESPCKK